MRAARASTIEITLPETLGEEGLVFMNLRSTFPNLTAESYK